MDKNVEHAKKLKEIADIIAERDELERLLKENNEIKLFRTFSSHREETFI